MLEPEVPFEIHRDRLRIEVKKDSGGSYETTTNIDFAENLRTDPHYAFKLDGSILTIYKITDKEHKVLELLNNIRKLPGEARASLQRFWRTSAVKFRFPQNC